MHESVQNFVRHVLTAKNVAGKRVLEVGSYDVNGSVRPYVESLGPSEYLGVDACDGPRVDRIADCEHLHSAVGGDWDIVITTEMLEHVPDWRACMTQLASVIAPDGLLVATTRSPGFPYHPYPDDFWRYTAPDMQNIMHALGLNALIVQPDPQAPGVFVLAKNVDLAEPPNQRGSLGDLEVTRIEPE